MLEYDKDLFRKDTANMILDNYVQLLESIITNENKPIIEYNILIREQKELYLTKRSLNPFILEDKNEPEMIKLVHQQFEEMTLKYPNNIALSFKNDHMSNKELNEKSNKLANYLK